MKSLVAQVGGQSRRIIWEPANEPDVSHKPITGYYEVYAHAFKALREADPQAQICGPSFAFPSYTKYRAFLDYCRITIWSAIFCRGITPAGTLRRRKSRSGNWGDCENC